MTKLLVAAIIVIANLGVLELLSAAYHYVERGQIFYVTERAARASLTARDTAGWLDPQAGLPGLRLHPTFGWANYPAVPGYNNQGLLSDRDYPTPPGDDFVIGVFGGSVAVNFWVHNQQTGFLQQYLTAHLPALQGRTVTVLNFAKEAYKFPQQSSVLTHMLLEGQRLDLVVNIEGFNEISSSWINWRRGIGLAMLGTDLLFALSELTRADQLSPANLNAIRANRIQAAGEQCRLAVCWLVHRLYVMWLGDTAAASDAAAGYDAAHNILLIPRGAVAGDQGMFLDRFTAAWNRSARIMDAIARSAGAGYLQILQPNQYFRTGRHFGDAEKVIAFSDDQPYAAMVDAGYRRMTVAGAALREQGLAFADATRIFDAVEAPIYRDKCCHYNQNGEQIFADFVARRIVEAEGGAID